MPERAMIGLDNPVFSGRLRRPESAAWSFPEINRQQAAPSPEVQSSEFVRLQPEARRQAPPKSAAAPIESDRTAPPQTAAVKHRRFSQRHAILAMAAIVFVTGLAVSVQSVLTNRAASAKVSALTGSNSHKSNNGESGAPSTVRPTSDAFRQYTVAPDLPRYIRIAKLDVNARVLQAGVNAKGALAAPSNVYDAAWYTGSAKPGEKGATLIDGHVSSWTSKGVFYGLKKLQPGDLIQVVRGDDAVLTYSVVKTQAYDAANVDMKAAVTPVTPGKSGLNLITCGGKVKPGTSEFTERLVVFAEQI